MARLMLFYAGENVEEFLRNMEDFPEVLLILPRDKFKYGKLAEEMGRIVNFLDLKEVEQLLKPDYVFYYSKFGGSIEEVAAKIKNRFSVLIVLGKEKGAPVALEREVKEEVAAPIIAYEISRLVRYY